MLHCQFIFKKPIYYLPTFLICQAASKKSIESKDTPFLSAFNLISSNHFLSVRIYSIKLFTFLMNSGLRTEYSYSFENVSYALSINPQPNFDRFASVAII